MRHVVRTQRVDLDWLFERIREDPGVHMRYINTKKQLGDFLTKGSFTTVEWQKLCDLANMGPNSNKNIPTNPIPKGVSKRGPNRACVSMLSNCSCACLLLAQSRDSSQSASNPSLPDLLLAMQPSVRPSLERSSASAKGSDMVKQKPPEVPPRKAPPAPPPPKRLLAPTPEVTLSPVDAAKTAPPVPPKPPARTVAPPPPPSTPSKSASSKSAVAPVPQKVGATHASSQSSWQCPNCNFAKHTGVEVKGVWFDTHIVA